MLNTTKDAIFILFISILFMVTLLFTFNVNGAYERKCKEAGGVPLTREFKCLNPSAFIRLE